MKILSECLHKDVPKDVIDIIKNTKYSVHQMQVSLEFYKKRQNQRLMIMQYRMSRRAMLLTEL